jgi:hypothetical protein
MRLLCKCPYYTSEWMIGDNGGWGPIWDDGGWWLSPELASGSWPVIVHVLFVYIL